MAQAAFVVSQLGGKHLFSDLRWCPPTWLEITGGKFTETDRACASSLSITLRSRVPHAWSGYVGNFWVKSEGRELKTVAASAGEMLLCLSLRASLSLSSHYGRHVAITSE